MIQRVLLCALLCTLGSCAALFNNDMETISISSDPAGAEVFVNGHRMGSTPLKTELPVEESADIEIRKEGYENRTEIVRRKVEAGWIILDVLGGVIPIIIDAATESWYGLEPEHVHVSLNPIKVQP